MRVFNYEDGRMSLREPLTREFRWKYLVSVLIPVYRFGRVGGLQFSIRLFSTRYIIAQYIIVTWRDYIFRFECHPVTDDSPIIIASITSFDEFSIHGLQIFYFNSLKVHLLYKSAVIREFRVYLMIDNRWITRYKDGFSSCNQGVYWCRMDNLREESSKVDFTIEL